jgi:parallel beta-helix repeat protein
MLLTLQDIERCDKMKQLVLVVAIIFSFSIIALGFSTLIEFMPQGFCSGSVIIVPDDYLTISAAVVAAQEGDTILVMNGTYFEPDFIIVDKSLTIVGQDVENTVIDGADTAKVIFQVLASNVAIENFTLQNTDASSASQGPGIRIYNVTNTILKNLKIRNTFDAVQIQSANFSVISNCTFSNNVESGILLRATSCNNTFTNNWIRNNVDGIMILDLQSGFNQIHCNDFENNINQVSLVGGTNFFDAGYPQGGNFWSDYMDVDLNNGRYQNMSGSDGIFDHAYLVDNYPLTNPVTLSDISAGNQTFQFQVSTNSTLLGYSFNEADKTLSIQIGGLENQTGTARVVIPRSLLQCEILADWTVTFQNHVNESENLQPLSLDVDAQNTYIFVAYSPALEGGTITLRGTQAIPEYVDLAVLLILISVCFVFATWFQNRNRKQLGAVL